MEPVKEVWALDEDGQLDDICVPAIRVLRMERMDANYWWMCLYMADGREIHMDLVADQSGMTLTKREGLT